MQTPAELRLQASTLFASYLNGFGDIFRQSDGVESVEYRNIERVISSGGAGDDLLIPGIQGGVLFGDGGDDVLFSRFGEDLLFGGAGADRYVFKIGFGTDILAGEIDADTELHFLGRALADMDFAADQGNLVISDGGDSLTIIDYFRPGPNGLDFLFGFEGAALARLDLSGLGGVSAGAETEGVVIIGGDGVDIADAPPPPGAAAAAGAATVTDGRDLLRLAGGDDLAAGSDGADIIDGGLGRDSVYFNRSAVGVTVDLSRGFGRGGQAEGDVFVSVENIFGSAFDDIFIGDGAANSFAGDDGDDSALGGGGGDFLSGGDGGDTLSGGESDDRIFGEAGDDELSGDARDDYLDGGGGTNDISGGAGRDTVRGGDGATSASLGGEEELYIYGGGADTVSGGDDVDELNFAGFASGVFIDVAASRAEALDGGVLFGTFDGFERFAGGYGDDRIAGGAGDDELAGGRGDETLLGGAGSADRLFGGPGFDTADYSDRDVGVVADLDLALDADGLIAPGQIFAGRFGNVRAGGADILAGIEALSGSSAPDVIIAPADGFTMTGGAGLIETGGAPIGDIMLGGAGVDAVDYSRETGDQGVTVDLRAAFIDKTIQSSITGDPIDRSFCGVNNATDTFGHPDAIAGVEVVIGSAQGDDITGAEDDVTLRGGAGADTLTGGDLLAGGAGDDNLIGDSGIVIHRVNAGGPAVGDAGGGLFWSADTNDAPDPRRVAGGENTFNGDAVILTDDLPDDAPAALFDDERWDPLGGQEMRWEFEATEATFYELRLYFVENVQAFTSAGNRIFDVAVEGVTPPVFDDIDPFVIGGSGNLGAGNRPFALSHLIEVTDGSLSVEFRHVFENPKINAIEVVRFGTGDDTLFGGAGSDRIDGGGGDDLALYEGALSDYALSLADDGVAIAEFASGDTDTVLETVERFRFGEEEFTWAEILSIAGNTAPAPADDVLTADEDDPGQTFDLFAANGGAADSDPDGDALTVVAVNGSAATVDQPVVLIGGGVVRVRPDGIAVFEPSGAYDTLGVGVTLTESFSYSVSDGLETATASVTLTIEGVNDAPVARDDGFSTDEETAIGGSVFADNGAGADSDVDGDPLNVSAVNGDAASVGVEVTLASGALLTVNPDGSFTYDPNGAFEDLAEGAEAEDSFAYTVSDGAGGTDTAAATVRVTGLAPDDGTPDDDVLLGGGDDDRFNGRGGDDRIVGRGGDDTLLGGGGGDRLKGNGGSDSLNGGGGKDLLIGNGGKDVLLGGGGRDTLQGGGGKDTLDGGGGRDVMQGGGGRDLILGGKGNDILTGQGGKDIFFFETGNRKDRITDWQDGRDKIQIGDGADGFDDLTITQTGADALIEFSNVRVTVEDTDIGDLTAADFIF